MCGSKLTREITDTLAKLGDDDAGVAEFGVDYATRQCADLIDNGVEGLHFYTLNKSRAPVQIVRNLNLAS